MSVCSLSQKGVSLRSSLFLEKKEIIFLEYFALLENYINFLGFEFEGCMNGKLQVWCKCTAPYIGLYRA